MTRPTTRAWAVVGTLLLACTVVAVPPLVGTASAPAQEVSQGSVVARADTFAVAARPGRDHGSAHVLRYGPRRQTRAYLQFAVPDPPGEILRAELVLTATRATKHRTQLSQTSTRWGEHGMTWRNAPPVGSRTGWAGPAPTGGRLVFDVTSVIHGAGRYAFVLTGRGAAEVYSRNAARHRPRITITTTGPTSSPTPTPTPTPPATPTATATATPTATPTATSTATATASGTPTPTPTPPPPSVVVALAGDVACGTTETDYNGGMGTVDKCRARHTAELISDLAPSTVFAMGDLQYPSGRLEEFNASYQHSWGQFKAITHPVVGNHEYGFDAAASGYFDYFGSAAGPRGLGYYSFNIPVGRSRWHIAVINGECARIGGGAGCAVGSAQYNWLDADLRNSATTCTAVLTHKPRWSSSAFYTAEIQPLVNLMDQYKVELLLAGHAHSYERFEPQTSTGQSSSTGIRQITVGTGGKDTQNFGPAAPHSVVRKAGIFGIEKLTLREGAYDWRFLADPTTPFSDSGSGSCF